MSDGAGRWPVASFGPIARARARGGIGPQRGMGRGDSRRALRRDVAMGRRSRDVGAPLRHPGARLRVLARRPEDRAERLEVAATTFGVTLRFDVRLEDGFCLMQARARLYLVLMAAEPHDGGVRTRFFHLRGRPSARHPRLRRHLPGRGVHGDFANLARLAARGF